MKGIFYIGEQPIDINQCTSIELNEDYDTTQEFSRSFSLSATLAYSRRVHRFFRERAILHNRVMKEIKLIMENPKHLTTIDRCVRYGNRIPRKYRKNYKELTRTILRGTKDFS